MSSAIDPTKPATGSASTESVRDNFQAAKDEIEQNQADIITAQATADAAATAAAAASMSAMTTLYPVGAIYISTLTTNPNTLLGFGTWSSFGAGRVLVSLDAEQTEFDTIEETGGAKTVTLTSAEMPSHTHTQDAHTHTQNAHTHTQNPHTHTMNAAFSTGGGGSVASGSIAGLAAPTIANATATNQNTTATNQNTTATNQNTGGGGAHENLQPYIVVKMWKRTA